jgi:hypothetical protein
MRHKIIDIYSFGELSDSAKEKAKQDYAASNSFHAANEYLESLRKLAQHFDGELKNYSIDWFNCSYSSADFEMPNAEYIGQNNLPDDIHRAIGESDATLDDIEEAYEQWLKDKLLALGNCNPLTLKGLGDCVLTGYCADEDAIDGFRIAYMAGERDLDKLMQAAFRSWLKAAQNDCEGFYENDYFEEHCQCNGDEFLEDGSPA